MSLIDSYGEEHYDNITGLTEAHPSVSGKSAMGQTFIPSVTAKLTSCKFYMKKAGSPTGDAHARLYTHTGTYGIVGIPTGEPLANSDAFDVSDLTTNLELVTFTFTGDEQYEMVAGTPYVIMFENPPAGISAFNKSMYGYDASDPAHSGNLVEHSRGEWDANDAKDDVFYVYGDIIVIPVINPLISKPLVAKTIIRRTRIR